MPFPTQRNIAVLAGLLLLIYCRYTDAGCSDISGDVQQYIPRAENGPPNEVFMNISEPNSVKISIENPTQYILLENITDGTNTRWILRVNGTLDAEQVNDIEIRFKCNDASTNQPQWTYSTRIVVTDVNEYPPDFNQSVYTVSVNEITPPGTEIFTFEGKTLNRDRTPTFIIYSVSSRHSPPLFGINALGTAIQTLRSLDYDFSSRQYNLTITAKEHIVNGKNSTALLVINIQDSDDLSPKFDRPLYNTTVNEGTYTSEVLEISPPIHAQDEDSGLTAPLNYSILESIPNDGIFSILANGSLMMNGVLRPETTYSVSIRVSQINRSQERYDDAVVLVSVVDINDNAPIMSATSYTATVIENSLPGTVVTTVNATDGDFGLNAAFVFYFVSRPSVFEIDTEGDTGIVKVAEGATIDREKQKHYNLQIYAQEELTSENKRSGNSTLNITVVDVNDNSPVFNPNTYNYNIYKNDTIGTRVGRVQCYVEDMCWVEPNTILTSSNEGETFTLKISNISASQDEINMVKATDVDEGLNGQIIYTIQHSTSSLFELDPGTGVITVNGTLGDDNIGQVYLVIAAQDQAPDPINRRTSVTTVTINIQNIDLFTPKFNSTTYTLTVLEDQPINSLLTQLVATDEDNGDILTYTVIAGNDNNTFHLETQSGVLVLVRALDRESRDQYVLTAQVSDGQKSSTAMVTVTVLDVNDNSPVFNDTSYTFSVRENTGPMATIGSVYATDVDAGPNKQITYEIMSENSQSSSFEINQTTGEISTSQNLDYEVAASHVMLVSATDHGDPARTATVTVHVNVVDVNDNSPHFVSDFEEITVSEGTSGIIFTAVAHDQDSGANKIIVYGLSGSATSYTVLSNGSINAPTPLTVGDTNITVAAYNTHPYDSTCNRCNNATITIMIHVADLNNQHPQFNQTVYSTTIAEGRVHNPVLRIYATDDDTDTAYNSIMYNVVGGANSNLVYLAPTSGKIYIFSDVDYDPPDRVRLFNFTVEAVNTADTSSKDTALVTITVTDVNDNAPTFDNGVYRCQVGENTATKTQFGCRVNATDIDSGTNAMFQYSLVQPSSAPFSVNSTTGEITLSRKVDYETETTYTLTVRAVDDGTPRQNSTCEVVVNVTDVNDNPPTFTDTPYAFSIPETSPAGTSVGTVSATDPDSNTNLTFRSVNHTEGIFLMQTTGTLQTTTTFNCSADYTLKVAVSDGVHEVIASVDVQVLGVNEFTPQFTATYTFTVMENATNGHALGEVEATDADCKANGDVSYSIIGGNTNQVFSISSKGEITVLNDNYLDYEAIKEYNILVRARDGGHPPRMNFTSVTITVVDVDDVPPVFDRLLFTATIPENSPNGTSILELSASDEDTSSENLRFGLKSPVAGLYVNTSGTVMVDGTLDADIATNVITATVTVTDGTRTAESKVRVTIEDLNDNSPVLFIGQKNISVPENADIGQVIVDVNATDRDRTNRGFTYWLTKTDGKFAINVSSGMITVENEFDRRRQDYFSVEIHVSDHGIPPRFAEDTLTVVIIDSNHEPVFNQSVFVFSVWENATIDSMVGQIAAYDEDKGTSGIIQYSFLSGNQDRYFAVDVNTGNITLRKSVDFEHQQQYTLSVEAKDTSYSPKSSTGTVIINVEDIPEAPQWPLPLPVVHMMKSRSCDKSRVTAFSKDITSIRNSPSPVIYRLFNETDKFSLDNSTGALLAVHPSSLAVGMYQLFLQACNYDYPDLCTEAELTIVVSSDTTLTFCPAFLIRDVLESSPIGYVVADLNTTDDDGVLSFSITEGNDGNDFAIDESTGVLTVNRKLDREITDRYALLIEAGNGTQTAQTQVVVRVIDVKDSIPTFPLPEYDGQISEGARVGSPVLMMDGLNHLMVTARDWDKNTQLTYSISSVSDTSTGSFSVNVSSGAITLAKSINREAMKPSLANKFTFMILATDENNTVSTTVHVTVLDVNDNDPAFDIHDLHITIAENTAVGVVVTKVNASDVDSVDQGQLTFSLLSPDDVPFRVNAYTGELAVSGTLDRENVSSYEVVIVVKDSGNRTDNMTVHVTLSDVNDNKPTFENSTYVFQVEEGPGGVNSTMTVSATDLDLNNQLTFTIISGNSDNSFRLETLGNEAVLMVVNALDREGSGMTPQEGMGALKLILQVEDDGPAQRLSSTCEIFVHVTDVNDNFPQFDRMDYTGTIRENSLNDTEVQVLPEISATDPDNGINGTLGIRYQLDTSGVPFRVDALNGTVFVFYDTPTDNIDREAKQSYQIQISAQDDDGQGKRSVVNLTITVIDVNDVTPTFVSPVYSFNISEAAQSRSIVGQVNATDNDVGGTSSIRYEIVSGDDVRFYIEALTGIIRVTGGLDREVLSEYSLNVSASDGVHSGYTTVNITIDDVNDNCPIFAVPIFNYNVTENSGNITLGVLKATDSDEGVNSQLTFFTNATAVQGLIGMKSDGTLATMTSLDRETRSRYIFLVYVSDDGSPPCVSSATVNVRVLDENDQTPVFCKRKLCDNAAIIANILEKSPINSVVALPQVRDGDEGENSRVTFSLVGAGSDLFNIDPDSGLVRIAKPIDINKLYERGIIAGNFSNNATFDLKIVAEDHGSEPLKSNVTLRLSVQEINDGAPEFNSTIYNFTIPEEQLDYTVGQVQASARNTTGLALVYSIIDGGQSEDFFSIDATDGMIRTVVKLDRETRDRYSFAVQVRDGRVPERTAYAVVFVTVSDINDNAPKFSPSIVQVNIKENSPPTDLLMVEATDADDGQNSRLTYTLNTPAGDTNLFTLNAVTGQLRVIGSLDREKQSSYTLNVTATDGGAPPHSSMLEVIVTVQDVNDNVPIFTNLPYVVYVKEDSPQGQPLLTVHADDTDEGLNGQVVYRLVSDLGSDVFQIGAIDGKLTTVTSLDYETTTVYHLTVMARDLGTPSLNSTTSITVHVNDTYDTKPHFTSGFYRVTVAVATPIGTPLNVRVDAGNGNFYFNITQGNDDNLFVIDPDTGIISVSAEITTQGNVLLTIMASDKMPVQSSAATKVYVTITEPEVTFPEPLFTVRIPENTPPPVRLLDLNSSAEVQGLPVYYFFTNQTKHKDAFTVNSSSGVLTCEKTLDREQIPEYKLFIQVAIATRVPVRSKRAVGLNIVEVVVAVEDKNDNPPTLQAPGSVKVYGIPNTAEANYLVVNLKAVDVDSGDNSVVKFSAASGNTDVFGVNPTSGEVRSLVSMTSLKTTQFNLTVNGTDRNGLGRSATMLITIKVITETERFGLVAHMQPKDFNKKKENLIGNLSSILAADVQLEVVQPHSEQDVLDLTRSDIYFHAIDPATGNAVPYTEILKRVTANQAAIDRLLGGQSLLLSVTPAPTTVPGVKVIREAYKISEAEIAVLVIAGVMFIGSVVALVAIVRIFKKYEEWHKNQEKAKLVRERQRKITEERTVDEGFNETNVDSDNAEPLDLDASEESGSREFNPGLLLRPTRMSDTLRSLPSRQASIRSHESYEDQEGVIVFGTETKECDTIVLRNLLVSRELDHVLQLFDADDADDSRSDSGTGLDDLAEDIEKSHYATIGGDGMKSGGQVQDKGKSSENESIKANTESTSAIQESDIYAKPAKSTTGSMKAKSSVSRASDKGSVKSDKLKNVRFTAVPIDPLDSGNSSGSENPSSEQTTHSGPEVKSPVFPTSVDHTTGDLMTWL